MAHLSIWHTLSFLPPTPAPCGYFWDVEELRHQEHLHRVSHAQYLCSRRNDSAEAMKVYEDFIREQSQWMAQQEELRDREAQLAVQARLDRASRWAEEWKCLESGESVEDVLMKSGATIITKSPFRRELSVTSVDDHDDFVSPSMVIVPRNVRSLNLSEAHLDWRSVLQGLPRFEMQCGWGGFIGIGQEDGAVPAELLGRTGDPAGISDRVRQNVCLRVTSDSPPNLPGCRLPKTRRADIPRIKPIVSPPPLALLTAAEDSPNNSSRPDNPILVSSVIPSGNLLAGGDVIRVYSHKRSNDARGLLYEVLWKSHTANAPPIKLWAETGDFLDARKKVELEEYHKRHKLGPVAWPRLQRKKHPLRTSGSLGVKELRGALDERKKTLLHCGNYDDRAAELLGKCRWMMRDEWQQRGRGWAVAIDVAERWKLAWEMADAVERHKARKQDGTATCEYGRNPPREGVSQYLQPLPMVLKETNASPSRQLDGGPQEPQYAPKDKYKSTSRDEEEWRGFFGDMDDSEPIMIDFTDDCWAEGISELGEITTTFPKAVGTWRLNHPQSMTPRAHDGKDKGEFMNLLRRDKPVQKSASTAASTAISVHSVLEAGAHLVGERKNLFSRLLPDRRSDKLRGSKTTTIASTICSPILKPQKEPVDPGPRLVRYLTTALDGECDERQLITEGELSQGNMQASQEEILQAARSGSPSTSSLARGTVERDCTTPVRTNDGKGSLDRDWRVRFLKMFSLTPGLSNLLAGARAYPGILSKREAREAAGSARLPFGIDGAQGSRLLEEDSVTIRLKNSKNVMDADMIRLQGFRRERERMLEAGIAEAAERGELPKNPDQAGEPRRKEKKRTRRTGAAATFVELQLLAKDPSQRSYREEHIVKKLIKRREKEDREMAKLQAALDRRLRHRQEKERCKELHELKYTKSLSRAEHKEYRRLKKKIGKREGFRIFLELYSDPYVVMERQRLAYIQYVENPRLFHSPGVPDGPTGCATT